MPNTKSAKRKVKKVAKQAIANKFWKRRSKLAIKKMEAILKKNNKKEAQSFYPKFQSELMKTVKKGIIKKEKCIKKNFKNFKKNKKPQEVVVINKLELLKTEI